jgi:hypothetical protein
VGAVIAALAAIVDADYVLVDAHLRLSKITDA